MNIKLIRHLFLNNTYSQMNKFLLVLVLLVITQNQLIAPRVGGYTPYTALDSPTFQAILQFIYDSHPEVSGWKVINVSRQLVNGYNWKVELSNDKNSASAVVYQQFSGEKQITSWSTDLPKNNTAADIQTSSSTASVTTPPIIVGGYQVLQNPSGEVFQYALKQALEENPGLKRQDLSKTEMQLVNGWNYRFTFKQQGQDDKVVTIYVPFNYQEQIQTIQVVQSNQTSSETVNTQTNSSEKNNSLTVQTQTPVKTSQNTSATVDSQSNKTETTTKQTTSTSTSTSVTGQGVQQVQTSTSVTSQPIQIIDLEPIVGGYTPVTDPSKYKQALDAIYKLYPYYKIKQYQVERVLEQIVAGRNFMITLKKKELDHAVFSVYVDLKGKTTVTLIEIIQVQNYTFDQINAAIARAEAKYISLEKETLWGVSNIWPGGRGLKLLYGQDKKESKSIAVFIYTSNNQEKIILL